MDDAEAEAVLLALGSALEWRKMGPTKDYWQARNGDCLYVVCFASGRRSKLEFRGAFRVWHDWNQGPIMFSIPAAKAACERHHATGKWE